MHYQVYINVLVFVYCRKRGQNLKPYVGNALAILLFAHAPHRANMIPTLNGIQLWRGRLKRESMKQIARMGLSIGYDGTIAALDRIRQGYDKGALECKSLLEKQLSEHPHRQLPTRDAEEEMETSFFLADLIPNLDEEIEPPEDEGNSIIHVTYNFKSYSN